MTAFGDEAMRPQDQFTVAVDAWEGGCLYCSASERLCPLPGLEASGPPLCPRHLRWAMASRRERHGRQAGRLRRLLRAWSTRYPEGTEEVERWLAS